MGGSVIVYGGGYWGTIHTAPAVLGDIGVVTRQNDKGKVEYMLSSVGHLIEIRQMSVALNDGRHVNADPYRALVTNANGELIQDKTEISEAIKKAIEYVQSLGYISGHVNTLPGGLGQNGRNGVKGTYLPPEINPNGNREVKITYLLEEMMGVHGKIPPKPGKHFSLSDLIHMIA